VSGHCLYAIYGATVCLTLQWFVCSRVGDNLVNNGWLQCMRRLRYVELCGPA